MLPDCAIDKDDRNEKQLIHVATNDEPSIRRDEPCNELPADLSGAHNTFEFVIHLFCHVWLTFRAQPRPGCGRCPVRCRTPADGCSALFGGVFEQALVIEVPWRSSGSQRFPLGE